MLHADPRAGESLRLVQLVLQLVQLALVADGVEQQFLQLVVALQAAAQIAQLGAQIQQLAKRLHLPGDVFGLEVVHALEMQVDLELWRVRIFGELVLDGECEMRLHALQHAVEIIRVDLDKFPVPQARQRVDGLAREISQDSHHEREFFQFNRVADLDVVGHVHARGPHAV